MPTLEKVIQEATTDYLEKLLTSGSNKSSDDIREELSKATLDQVEFVNSVRPKGHKLRTPSNLTPYQIAEVVLATRNVVSVACAGDTRDPDYDVLAVYQDSGPDEGLYDTTDLALERLISEYNVGITKHEIEETLAILKRKVPHKVRNSDRDLIAVNNGIFDYRTKTLRPFSPDYVFLTKSRVNYNPGATNAVIHNDNDGTDWDVESWLCEVVPDAEVRQLIWEILGAIIRPFVRWNKSAWFYSTTGNNGKGTLCALMRNLCGPGTYASIPLSDFGKEFHLEPLLRASAIIVDENDVGTYIDKAANLKAVITGDTIQVNRKFKLPVAYRFCGFMVQCLNEMPRVKDKSNSFYRRQLFVPFTQCFTGMERKYIKDDYLNRPEVLEYVLWKVLNMNYYQLSEPEACKAALDEYKTSNDPLAQFLEEILPQLVWDLIPLEFIYDLYRNWLRRNNPSGTALGKNIFAKELFEQIKLYPDWAYDRDKIHKPGHLMDCPEPLIREYSMELLYGIGARRKSGYRGLRRIASQCIVVDDEDQDD